MRYFFLILSFFLTFSVYSQVPDAIQYRNEEISIPWKQQYPLINCQPSFYWSLTYIDKPNIYGQYLYKMYFMSNSRYCNGVPAGTYINGISIWINGYLVNPQNKYWIFFKEIYHPPAFEFWAPPRPYINFTWDYVSVN